MRKKLERMWNDAIVFNLIYCICVYLEGLRKSTDDFC